VLDEEARDAGIPLNAITLNAPKSPAGCAGEEQAKMSHSFNRCLGAVTGVGPRLSAMEESLPTRASRRTQVPRSPIASAFRAVLDGRMTIAPAREADLPPFTNQSGRCARCAGRGPIRAGIAL
jgi:hypothetical protein